MSFPPETSKLDERQIMQSVFDEENRRLRTDAAATISDVSIAVDLDPSEDGVFIADKDSGNKLKVEADGSINVNTENPDQATADKQDQQIALLTNISNNIVNFIPKHDEINISTRDAEGNPTIVQYKLSNTLVGTMTITYDVDGNVSNAKVV